MKIPSYLTSPTNLAFISLIFACIAFTAKGILSPEEFMFVAGAAVGAKFKKTT